MKKLLSLLLALTLVLSLLGCGPTDAPSADSPSTHGTQPSTQTQATLPPETTQATQPIQTEPSGTEAATAEPMQTAPVQAEPEQTQPPQTRPTQPPQTQPTTPPITTPATEPTTEPTTEPVTEPTTEPVTEPTTEPVTEPTTEPVTEPTAEPETEPQPYLDPNGSYTTKEDVALYIHLYGKLPKNFITKSQARSYGWSSGSLERYAPGKCIGGDTFQNREGLLPKASGRTYKECDIDTLGSYSGRGSKRIVFSNDGLVYYTDDHYVSFTLLYGEP